MGVLQLTSNLPGSGKTSFIAALALGLAQEGRGGASYYKPLATADDADVAFMLNDVLGAPATVEPYAPLGAVTGPVLNDAQTQQLRETAAGLEGSHGVVLLEGPSGHSPLAAKMCEVTGAKTVLVVRPSGIPDVDVIIPTAEALGDGLAGVIANGVTMHRVSEVSRALATALGGRGVPLLGVIPELRTMCAPTVDQLAHALEGNWVQEPEDAGALIERFLIGGNIMDSGEEYYGRYSSQAVITRSRRTDIQLACLMHGTKCLVLTEGGEAAGYIQAEAMQRGVPVMVVESSTEETADALAALLSTPATLTIARVRAFAERLPEYVDMGRLMSLLE